MPVNEIQVGRFNGLLHKLLNMSEGSPSPSLATDIFPMIQLEGERPEWEFLKGGRLWTMFIEVAAGGVGKYSNISVRNPPSSGIISVVTEYQPFCASGGWGLSLNPNTSGALTKGYLRDIRGSKLGTQIRSATGYVTDTTLVTTAATLTHGSAPGNQFNNTVPFVLAPGDSLRFTCQAANAAMNLWAVGYERAMEPSESR